jgi:outer membrane immunogenic protein
MRKPLLASIALALQVAGPALAADLPVAPIYSVTPAVYSWWTGCYVGGSAGGAWSNVSYTAVIPTLAEDFGFNPSSYSGGIQVGCQYQWNAWVFGIEGSFSAIHLNQTHPSALLVPPPTHARSIDIDKIYTITPRLGYTWGRTMLYFKGGLADVRVNTDAASSTGEFANFTQVNSGWTFGLGLEHVPWKDIIVGLEFDYYKVTFDRSGLDTAGVPIQFSNTGANIYAVTVRLSYLFGPPVVTNY